MAMFHCEAVGLEFLDSAPVLLATTVTVNRPPDEVFAAFAHDPATWGEFFPGFDRSGYYHTPGPHGVGSGYAKRFLGSTVEERVLAWDEGKRFASRVERTSLPVFHAWVEDYRFEPDGGNGTLIRIAIGGHPRVPVKLANLVLPRALPAVLNRAGRNLESGQPLWDLPHR
jgi:hypothetical protein